MVISPARKNTTARRCLYPLHCLSTQTTTNSPVFHPNPVIARSPSTNFHSTPHATLFRPPSHLMIHIKCPGMKLPLAFPPLKIYTDKKTGGAIHPCPANKHWTHSPS